MSFRSSHHHNSIAFPRFRFKTFFAFVKNRTCTLTKSFLSENLIIYESAQLCIKLKTYFRLVDEQLSFYLIYTRCVHDRKYFCQT